MLNWLGWQDGAWLGWVTGDTPVVTPTGGYAAANMFTYELPKLDDDDDIFMLWFMFMRQPYEN